MLKRICAWFLCIMLLAALPFQVFAATTEEEEAEEQRISDQIADVYKRVVRATGRYSLEGWCGLMAGWELYYLGVNSGPLSFNGNDQYDAYRYMETTDKGYHISRYHTSAYTMEEAMNTITRCGTMDAYNILAGYQKTRTAAGQKWGHVTIIHAVLNGTVYYTEGFDTPYGLKPSEAHVCTIEEWADFYETWTTFEGLVVFGTKAYTDFCTYYPANFFATAEEGAVLFDKPGSQEMMAVRESLPGERLRVIGLYENTEGKFYYQIDDGDRISYMPAEQVKPLLFDFSDVTAQEIAVPEALALGEDFTLAGNLYSTNNRLRNICIQVLDTEGTAVLQYDFAKDSCFFDLGRKTVNNRVDLSKLAEGNYTYRVTASVINHYVADGQVVEEPRDICLADSDFTVGNPEPRETKAIEVLSTDPLQGWQYQDQNWYFYTDGTPRTGWFCYNGLDYYLREDGTAATGWQEINGKDRYFSVTGALRTGWLDTYHGKMYLLRNGVAATGWRTVEDKLYCFNKDGILLTDCTAEKDGVTYTIDPSGVASVQEQEQDEQNAPME